MTPWRLGVEMSVPNVVHLARHLFLIGAIWLPAVTLVAFCPHAYAQQQPSATNSADEQQPAPLTADEMEVLVARIALYPDELVALISSASLYPLQTVEAARYLDNLKKDAKLKPKDSWDGSVVSLLNYPEIVRMMSDDLDWTQTLSGAIAYQQKDVLVAIQLLRDKAVADNIIKTDDKIKVIQENDNVIIQAANPEKIYVPRYEPAMLYAEDYEPVPLAYYPEPYPNYYYPTATFFAGVVTGAIFGAVVDWDNWGVWGGRFDGNDIDIDCNKCFNNIDVNGKLKFNDVDWKNVDRSKIKFDRDQFAKLDRTNVKNRIEADGRNNIRDKAKLTKSNAASELRQRAGSGALKDVRANKVTSRREGAARRPDGAIAARRPDAAPSRPTRNVKESGKITHAVSKQRPAAKLDNRPRKPSALGEVRSGKVAKIQSNRGGKAMGGGISGGGRPHREIHRGGGGGGAVMRRGGGGGGRRR